MRAIDADTLTEIIHGMYAEGDNPSTYHVDAEGDTLIGKFAVVDAIFNMPTIQPEIVRCEECLYRKICSCEKQGAKFCSFAEKREVTT